MALTLFISSIHICYPYLEVGLEAERMVLVTRAVEDPMGEARKLTVEIFDKIFLISILIPKYPI